MTRPIQLAIAMAATLLIAVCGDGGTEPEPPNRAPVVSGSIPAQTVPVGESVTVSVASAFSDPDGDALTYAAASSAPGVVSVAVSGSDVTVTGVSAGAATVTVTASDPEGLSAQLSFEVTVPNRPPLVTDSIPAQTVHAGESVTLDLAEHFSDPDGDALAYVAASSAPGVVSVAVSGSDVTVTGVSAGAATVTVTASDPEGLSAQLSFEVTVPNRPPLVTDSIPAQTVHAGESVTLDLAEHFSDPDGDTLSFAASTSDSGVVSVSVSGWAVSITGVAQGSATVAVTATDPEGLSAQASFAVATTRPLDWAALVALYQATQGAGWTKQDNWLSDKPLAEWHGVETNRSGRVVALNLGDNNLDGPIPPELGKLSELKKLDIAGPLIRGRGLQGRIPAELGELSKLESLDLVFNNLDGPIPPELGKLSKLGTLDLSFNNLAGRIPPELGELSELANLELSANDLDGRIPPELGELSKLRVLDLDLNNLNGPIPPELGKLSELRGLDLSRNRFDGRIPPELGDLSKLRVLNLTDGDLEGQIPPELGNLSALRYLFLESNDLDGRVPPELGNLSKLFTLDLESNDLDGPIPAELAKLSELGTLSLSNNDLGGAIPPELGGLSKLRSLGVAGNPALSGALPRSFMDLENLLRLYALRTGLCAPSDEDFQEWLDGLEVADVETCSE